MKFVFCLGTIFSVLFCCASVTHATNNVVTVDTLNALTDIVDVVWTNGVTVPPKGGYLNSLGIIGIEDGFENSNSNFFSQLIGETNSLWQKEWTLDSATTFGDIAGDLYIEGTEVSDGGETSRPANRIGWNDPRTVESAKNKIVVWSTDYTNDKTEYDLLKYSDVAGVFYKITQRDSNWNTGYPKEDTLTVNSLIINPVHG